MKTIKIAPNMNEWNVEGNTVTAEFNGYRFTYTIRKNVTFSKAAIDILKNDLSECIALCSKSWQVIDLANHAIIASDGLPAGELTITKC